MSRNDKRNGPVTLELVNSSRLRSLRASTPPNPELTMPVELSSSNRLPAYIAEQVAALLAAMPPGKQKSLFKIRYGVTPDELQTLSIERVTQILKSRAPGDEKAVACKPQKRWQK